VLISTIALHLIYNTNMLFSLLLVLLSFPAHALDRNRSGVEAGSGPYVFSSKITSETDKSGLTAYGALNRRFGFGRGYFSGAAGIIWTAIEGQNAVTVQKINQTALLLDTSYLFEAGQFAFGIGARHVAGPGAGNEFLKPTAFAWSFYAGPRASFNLSGSPLSINVSLDTSLNLAAGRGNFFLLSLAYRFGEPQVNQTDQTVQSDGANTSQTPSTPGLSSAASARESAPESASEPVQPTNREFLADHQILIVGQNHRTLTLRLKSYLQVLSEGLLGPHAREWDLIEIRIPSTADHATTSLATAIKAFFLENGVGAKRLKITQTNDSSSMDIVVHALNLGMVGYLEARDRTFAAGRIRYSLNDDSQLAIKQFKKLKIALLDRGWAWKYSTVIINDDGSHSSQLAIKEIRQAVHGASRFDVIVIPSSELKIDLEIDGVRDNQALGHALGDELQN
jgi:hypothetical protein